MSTYARAIGRTRERPRVRTQLFGSESIVPLLLLFAGIKVLAQIAITLLSEHAGYGIYRDELYYLVCGHHLAFGYVDQPPLVALQARLAGALFGYHNLVAFRLLPALAGAGMVALTGAIANELGGSRRAVVLAMLFVLTTPVFLATQSFLSMNAWSPVFWMGAVLAVLRLLVSPSAVRWWLVLGVSIGLGVENKVDTTFLAISLLLALLVVPSARRLLRNRGMLFAIGIVVLLALPNLAWQAMHGFPTWEWLRDVQHSTKDVILSPPRFLWAQVLMLSPLHLLVWLPGVLWLLLARAARPWRFAGALYLFFVIIMLALHAKDYYLAPIYPLYMAAGAVFWTRWAETSRRRGGVLLAGACVITAAVVLSVPFAAPVLSPATYVRYTRAMHLTPIESERHAATPLPEFFADQMGWRGLADAVERVYRSLPTADQAQTGIVAGNYGQASAINVFDRAAGLPFAISGHQNYWLWGPHGYSGREMIVVTDQPLPVLLQQFRSCTLAVAQTNPYQMPWEQRGIYVCHDRNAPYTQDWAAMKLYW